MAPGGQRSAKEAMTGPGSSFNITPSDLDSSGSQLDSFGDKLGTSSSKLTATHSKLVSSSSRDKSGVGSIISKFASKSEEVMGKLGQEASRVAKAAGARLKGNGAAHAQNEEIQLTTFKKIETKSSTTKAHTGEDTAPKSTKTSSGADFKDPKTPHGDSGGGETTKPSSSGSGNGEDYKTPKNLPGESGGGQSTQPSSSGSGDGGGFEPPKPPKGNSGDGSGEGSGGSGGPGGHGGGDGGGGGGGDPHGGGSTTPQSTPPVTKEPMSSNGNPSQQYTNQPNLPPAKTYDTKTPGDNDYGFPPDRSRGSQVETLDKDRVTRGDDGLIKTVDGKPVKDYVADVSKQKAEQTGNPALTGKKNTLPKDLINGGGKEKVCSAVAIDLKTGSITHGVNGKPDDVIPPENLHPLLQNNYQNLRAHEHNVDGGGNLRPGQEPAPASTMDGRAHASVPNNHAEVKATNELLWQRQNALKPGDPPLDQSTLNEMRFDPRWTGKGKIGGEAPACANCNTILDGVPSYTGRYNYDPKDSRYTDTMVPPHNDTTP
jgi:hypothetical protein